MRNLIQVETNDDIINTWEIAFSLFWGLITPRFIIGQCLRCHATFVNGKNIEQMHTQKNPFCSHKATTLVYEDELTKDELARANSQSVGDVRPA